MNEPRESAMDDDLEPIERPKRLVEITLDTMRKAIIDGDWELGRKLSESSIARQLGVSKTPVREALVLLRREGLVDIRPQSGTRVFTLQPGELTHICDLRQALETAAVRLVAAEPDGLATLGRELTAITERMRHVREQGDIRAYLRLDDEFHHALVRGSGNPYLVASYDLVAGKIAALRTRLGTDPHHLEKSFAEHCEIAERLGVGEPEDALELLSRHIARKEGSYWQHLQADETSRSSPPGVERS